MQGWTLICGRQGSQGRGCCHHPGESTESAPWEWKGDDRSQSLHKALECLGLGTWVEVRGEELFGE